MSQNYRVKQFLWGKNFHSDFLVKKILNEPWTKKCAIKVTNNSGAA